MVPPAAVTVASPSHAALHDVGFPEADAVNAVGSVTVKDAVAVHPLASVIVI